MKPSYKIGIVKTLMTRFIHEEIIAFPNFISPRKAMETTDATMIYSVIAWP